MKLVTLNIWDARVFKPLMDFFERNQDVDIFCLQEVFNGSEAGFFREDRRINGFTEISKRLAHHQGFFANTEELDDTPPSGMAIPYGVAIFAKKDIEVLSYHQDFVFGTDNFASEDAKTHKRAIQTINILHNNKKLAISNVHGLWNGQGKTDTPDRISQSNKIKVHITSFNSPVVLAGDFNLLPNTESLSIISNGMRDLVEEYDISSTRSSLYTKHTNPVLFADYIFTSPEIKINNFEVMADVVSDHLPLAIDFE